MMHHQQNIWAHIVLYQPQIPQNTGNISRFCYALGAKLHLIEPLGFLLEDKYLKRAGLDYWPVLAKQIYKNWEQFLQTHFNNANNSMISGSSQHRPAIFPVSTMGLNFLYDKTFPQQSYFIFGSEDSGLPAHIMDTWAENTVTLPQTGSVRSLNLANAAAVVLYEYWRQQYTDQL